MDKIIRKFWEKGIIVTADAIEIVRQLDEKTIEKILNSGQKIITKEFLQKFLEKKEERKEIKKVENMNKNKSTNINLKSKNVGILKYLVIEKVEKIEERKEEIIKHEKPKEETKVEVKEEKKEVVIIEHKKRSIGEEIELNVEILKSYDVQRHEINVQVWVSYFKARLNQIKKIIKSNYPAFANCLTSDQFKKDMEDVYYVGLIRDKRETSKGLVLTLEDGRGIIKAFIPNSIQDYDKISSVPLDSVVGIKGDYNKERNLFYVEEFYFPDIPYKEKKTVKDDVWIAFTGDFQIGNKAFLKEAFERFIKWLKGEYGNEKMREIARKVGYIIFAGDLVDGVGIYPNQEKELEINTIEKQYEVFEKYALEIPEDKQVIIIPGNHDAVRLAEPQPPIPKEFLPELYEHKNYYLLSNPSYVRIHRTFTVLIYHGYSLDAWISMVPYIRDRGGYENPGEALKYILMVRHLAPTHGFTPYVPYAAEDPLVVDPVPDIFVTGHIHRTYYGEYKGTELIVASCFQDITPFQLELGHKPDPGKVILRNLKTGEVLILNFLQK